MKEILLSSGDVAFVDDDDFSYLSRFKWNISNSLNTKYAITSIHLNERRVAVTMHRMIMRFSKLHVDHINRNGLDNQKSNLRLCGRSENMANTRKRKNTGSIYRGVSLANYKTAAGISRARFQARVNQKGKRMTCGTFSTEEEAALAYDYKAIELFGEFASLNFPDKAREYLAKKNRGGK